MAENSDVFVRFGADIDPLKKDLRTATEKLDQFGKKARGTVNQMGKIAVASAAAAAAIGGKLVSDSLDAIDVQAKLARQLGTTSASIATLDRAAEMGGVKLKSIEIGFQTLEVVIGEASEGVKSATDKFDRLGISFKDLEGLTLDEKIVKINNALDANVPKTEQAAAASDLFGKKAGFAIRQLTEGGIKEATRQMEGFGLAISDLDALKVEVANDAMSSIGRATDGVIQQFTIQLAPILGKIATRFQEAAIEAGGFEKQAISAINSITRAVGFLGNSFRSIEIVFKSIEIAINGFNAIAVAGLQGLSVAVDTAVNFMLGSVNRWIDSINSISPIKIDKLITGDSTTTIALNRMFDGMMDGLKIAKKELSTLMDEKLPSKELEVFIIKKDGENGGPTTPFIPEIVAEIPDVKEDPEVIAARARFEELLLAQQEFEAESALRNGYFKEDELKTAAEFNAASDALDAIKMQMRLGAAKDLFGNLSTLMNSENKKLFEIGKAAALSGAVVDGISAAISSFDKGAQLGGPVVGGLWAAASVAATGVQIASLASTTFGSKSQPSTGGVAAPPTSSPQQAPAQPEQQRTVRFDTLDPSALVTGAMVNSVAEQLVELQNDGFTLVA